ncbi:MAG: motility associated factor glycosyltransferase family protein [Candidatus Muiribacteriota bacterium]
MLKSNQEALKKKDVELFFELKKGAEKESISVEIIHTKKDELSLKAAVQNSEVLIHSKRAPLDEAARFVDKVLNSPGNFFIINGMGLGYHIKMLFEKFVLKDTNNKLIVVEPSYSILKKAFETFDFSDLINHPNVEFAAGLDTDVLRNKLSKLFKMYERERVKVFDFNSYRRLFPEFLAKADSDIKNTISVGISNYTTVKKYVDLWNENILKNLKNIIKTPGVLDYQGKFKNKPAIVVSAGPSLDKNGIYLKQAKNKSLIIAVDTAVKPLLSMGVIPDVVISVDSQYVNFLHLEGVKLPGVYCVCSPIVYPDVAKIFDNNLIFFNFYFQLSMWIEKQLKENGVLFTGGSVATVAFDFARKIGADPIVFAGQDLAFTSNYFHAVNTYRDEKYFNNLSDTASLNERHKNKILSSNKTIIQKKDIYGRKVSTFRVLDDYCKWIEYECGRTSGKMINATEGGILKNNVINMKLKDVIEKYMQQYVDIEKIFSENWNVLPKKKIYDFSKNLNNLVDILKFTKEKAPQGKKNIKKLYDMLKNNNISRDYQKLAQKTEKLGKAIEEKIASAPFVVEKFQTLYWPVLRKLNSNPDFLKMDKEYKTLEHLNIKYEILQDTADSMFDMFFNASKEIKQYLKELK